MAVNCALLIVCSGDSGLGCWSDPSEPSGRLGAVPTALPPPYPLLGCYAAAVPPLELTVVHNELDDLGHFLAVFHWVFFFV